MTLKIEHQKLIAEIAAVLAVGLERDGWKPTTIEESKLHPKYRELFALERARNIVQGLMNDQELAGESNG